MKKLAHIIVFFTLLAGCGEKAAEFYANKDLFENNWWAYRLWNVDYCFNVYETGDVWLYEEFEERARIWYPWTFTHPNIYTIEGYEFTVVEDEDCYKITVSGLTDVVCDCKLNWDWRPPADYYGPKQPF